MNKITRFNLIFFLKLPQGMPNGPQHGMISPQGLPSGPGGTAGPGGEMPPNTQPTMPMSTFNQGQPMAQGGYRGPVMPGQGPTINSMLCFNSYHISLSITILFVFIF